MRFMIKWLDTYCYCRIFEIRCLVFAYIHFRRFSFLFFFFCNFPFLHFVFFAFFFIRYSRCNVTLLSLWVSVIFSFFLFYVFRLYITRQFSRSGSESVAWTLKNVVVLFVHMLFASYNRFSFFFFRCSSRVIDTTVELSGKIASVLAKRELTKRRMKGK